jgi:hypothetical protein
VQRYGDDGLIITLDSLTRHLVVDLHRNPTMGLPSDSLRLSLATSECFLDEVYHQAYRRNPNIATDYPEGKDVSAHVSGLTGLDDEWDLDFWASECVLYSQA